MTYARCAIVCTLLPMVYTFSPHVFAAEAAVSPFTYVCRDAGAGGYQAFPDVCRLKDGRLMCVFYAGYGHGSPPNARWPKGGRIAYCTSGDEGHSWSEAKVLYDGPDDDRDPSIVQLPNGQLLCNFFDARGGKVEGTWLVRSSDAGGTWSPPQKVVAAADYACSSPVRRLSNGWLVMGLYHFTAGWANGAAAYSDDGGVTWSPPVAIPTDVRLDAETDVIELTDGSLYAAQRSPQASMCFSISKNRGQGWSASKPIGFPGHCPYLHRTRNGIIVLAYRFPPASSTCLRYSLDECKTWSREIVADRVFGAYPSMVNLKDGSVLIVYYEEGANSAIRAKRFRATGAGVAWLSP